MGGREEREREKEREGGREGGERERERSKRDNGECITQVNLHIQVDQ